MRLPIALALSLAAAPTALIALAPAPAAAQTRPPVDVGPPNAADQSPAFPQQTRAPQPAADVDVAVATVAEGLPESWAFEFLPDGRMLVTAKAGAMHVVTAEGRIGPEIDGVPEVDDRRQGGLLDVALSPDFADTGLIFFSFSEPRGGGLNTTAVARARLDLSGDGAGALRDVEVILRQTPDYAGTMHYGSRLAFAPDGLLFVTVGERSDRPIRDGAQDLDNGLGKVFRIHPDGSAPQDNPFVGDPDAVPQIWSYGHRNLQSAVVDDGGTLWTVEHGPRGGDELNRPEAGLNYGWPIITYGEAYSGAPVGEGITQAEGMEQPVYYWDPVIAPSGMAQYEGDLFPAWRGQLLIGGLRSSGIVVLDIGADGRVATEARVPLGERVRDVKVGADGAVYALTDASPSRILKLTPGSPS